MLKHGYVTQDGSTYVISDMALPTTTPALDRAIKLMLETADALHAFQNGQQKRLRSNRPTMAQQGGPIMRIRWIVFVPGVQASICVSPNEIADTGRRRCRRCGSSHHAADFRINNYAQF